MLYASTCANTVPLRSSSRLKCQSNHSLDQCQKFEVKNVSERKESVPKHNLCNVCLESIHVAKNCRSPRSCGIEECGRRHYTFLHRKQEEQRDSNGNAYINTQLCTEEGVKSTQREK